MNQYSLGTEFYRSSSDDSSRSRNSGDVSTTMSPTSLRRSGARGGIRGFAVMGKLGEGGYGTVFLSRHKATGSLCALKMLLKGNIRSDIQAERVLSEAQALAEVNHPYIVALHGAFQDETHIFFVLSMSAVAISTHAQDGSSRGRERPPRTRGGGARHTARARVRLHVPRPQV